MTQYFYSTHYTLHQNIGYIVKRNQQETTLAADDASRGPIRCCCDTW